MTLLDRAAVLWRNLFHKRQVEADLDNELRAYQQLLEDEKLRAGADPETARRDSMRETGSLPRIKEDVRGVRLGITLETLAAELRQSLRGLRRNPALTTIGTLMLALGIGAGAVVFSIFYTVLLQPLPFRDPQRLFQLWETRPARGFNQASFTEGNFWDVRSQNHSFAEVACYHYDEANMTGTGPAEKVVTIAVSAGFLRTLGVSPILGRDFAYEEAAPRATGRVAILGNRFWRNRLAADPNVLGRTIRLNDRAYTVIGVLPPGEPWIDDQIYVPFGYTAGPNRSSFEFQVVARLAPGISIDTARADLQRIAATLAREYPIDNQGMGFRMDPSAAWMASDNTRRALWVLLGAVTFLLLIACLNIANLLLARGLGRQREIAVRTALGAARARLVRFIMGESLLLATFGAVFGLTLAQFALRSIQALQIAAIPRLAEARLHPAVLAYAAAMVLFTGIFCGLAPALQSPAGDIAAVLRDGDRQTGSRRQGRLRAVLVAGEVALSFLLLAGAGLLIRSFSQLLSVDPGFHTDNRLVFSVSMPDSYWEHGTGKQFLDRFFARLAALPDVIAAGAISHRPVEGGDPGMSIDSQFRPQGTAAPWAGWRVISPGYFDAVGLALVRGRTFDAGDKPVWGEPGQPAPPRRVIISQRMANLIFPGQDAVGKHATLWKAQSSLDAEVVGVVADSRERGPAGAPSLTVYIPYGNRALPGEVVLHTRGNPLALAPAVRSLVASLDPNLPVSDVRTFEEVMHRSVAPQRFNAVLLAIFGGLALVLASTGIYGVLSYSMSRRTPEIGLRVALGASSRAILAMTIRQGMRPVLAGMLAGALGAVWLTRYFTTLLFGIRPFDPLTYAGVAALLLATALLACYLPGRRATRIDPAVALRLE